LRLQLIEVDRLGDELKRTEIAGATSPLLVPIGRDLMLEESPNLFEIMATTRSMRRLKPDPVPAEFIRKILHAEVAASV
jgi:hypothetical protein